MSFELIFWKQSSSISREAESIYEDLCEQRPITDIEELPITEIKSAVLSEFVAAVELSEQIDWSGGEGSFLMEWSNRHIRFDCFRILEEDMNRIIDLAVTFDCRLYDPQTNTRYSG